MSRDVIIGLCGRAGAGKDSAAAYLQRRYGFVAASFAAALKDMLADHLSAREIDYAYIYEHGLKDAPIPGLGVSGRELLQRFGDAGRAAHPDYWVRALADTLGLDDLPGRSAPVHDRIVITDVRYPNEAALVLRHGGMLLRLQRECAAPVREHSSEQHVDQLPAHHTLVNNGPTLEGLHSLLDGMMSHCDIDPRQGGREVY